MSTTTGPSTPSLWRRPLVWPCVVLIYAYKVTLSPFMGRQCRFVPTCSDYALGAYRDHGLIRGTTLTLKRLSRCHPLSAGGYDPTPPHDGP